MSETHVTVAFEGGMTFRGTDEGGLSIVMDAVAESGGQGNGPSPMKLLAMALGGCTGMDVLSIVRKMRENVTGYEVRVGGPRAGGHPQVFTAMTVEHIVRGRNLDAENVRRAVELSATRYCPASAMLSRAAPVTHRYQVLNEDGSEVGAGTIG